MAVRTPSPTVGTLVEAEYMTGEEVYASHPEYLPGFMNDPRDVDGRQITTLDYAESRSLEADSLKRFPPTFSAALDWEAATFEDRRWWAGEEDWEQIAADVLAPFVRAGRRVAVFWGDPAIPTVTAPADVIVRHAQDVLVS